MSKPRLYNIPSALRVQNVDSSFCYVSLYAWDSYVSSIIAAVSRNEVSPLWQISMVYVDYPPLKKLEETYYRTKMAAVAAIRKALRATGKESEQ